MMGLWGAEIDYELDGKRATANNKVFGLRQTKSENNFFISINSHLA